MTTYSPVRDEPARARRWSERRVRRELRAGLLRLGGHLGWDTQRVVRFSEAVTRRSWRRCGRGDLERVVAVFAELASRMRATSQEAHALPEQVSPPQRTRRVA